MFDDITFIEATRKAAEAVATIGTKYGLDLDDQNIRESLAEMFQEGMKYTVAVLQGSGTEET